MLSLWSSVTQRLGVCTNRLIQASKSVSSPLLTGTRTANFSSLSTQRPHSRISQQHLPSFTKCLNGFLLPSKTCPGLASSARSGASFEYMHRTGLYKKVRRKERHPLEGNPQLKGVVLKVLVKKPKKPNSANRKCVRLRLTNGKEVTAYVPGEGHNLQEHNVVLVEGGRLQDTPGVKLTCVRGKYDLPHVKKRVN